MEELRRVEEKWTLIGRALGVEVDNIMYLDLTDCLREVVRRKLQTFYPISWKVILGALKSANEPQVADNLKAKYTPGELTTTTPKQHGENEMM